MRQPIPPLRVHTQGVCYSQCTTYLKGNNVEHVPDHTPCAQGAVLTIPWRRYKIIFNYHAPNMPTPHSLAGRGL